MTLARCALTTVTLGRDLLYRGCMPGNKQYERLLHKSGSAIVLRLLLLLETVIENPCLRVYVAQIHIDLSSWVFGELPESNRRPQDWQSRALTNWANFTLSRIKTQPSRQRPGTVSWVPRDELIAHHPLSLVISWVFATQERKRERKGHGPG